ncbi:MAG: hypothetical protein VX620_15560 [Pseudomonadota bacterium]|nr:hypothetical protein [Pseudomonadota bacterium]
MIEVEGGPDKVVFNAKPDVENDLYRYIEVGPEPSASEIPDDAEYTKDGDTVTAMRRVQPKPGFDLEEYKHRKIEKVKRQAHSILLPSDYEIIKASEIGATVSPAVLTYRAAVRASTNTYESEIDVLETAAEVDAVSVVWPEPL